MGDRMPSARALARQVKDLTWRLERAQKENTDAIRTIRALRAENDVLRQFDAHAHLVLSEVRTHASALRRAAEDLEHAATQLRAEAIAANQAVSHGKADT